MAVKPIVRYMLLCDNWLVDPGNERRVTIVGLISNIRATEEPAYPLLYREFCVFLALTEGREHGKAQIVCILEEDGRRVFATREWDIAFSEDLLDVIGVPCRIRNCLFPQPGLYSVQFWYKGELVEERPLRLR